MKKIFYLILPALLLAACSKDEQGSGPGKIPQAQEVQFALTRNGSNPPADGTTFRVMAYNSTGDIFQGTGTYVYRTSSQYGVLIPCRVNNDGSLADNGNYAPNEGLKLANETYAMALVSPAVAYDPGTFNTFAADRTQPFMASAPETIKIDGYGVYGFTKPLSDMRSYIDGFTFILGEELTRGGLAFTIDNLKLINVGGGNAKFHANKGGVVVDGLDDEPTIGFRLATQADVDDEIAKGRPQEEAERLHYVTTTKEYIFSPVYEEQVTLDEDDNPITSLVKKALYLQFDIEFEATKTVRLPLLYDFEPSKTYRFNITVSTIYVNLSVEVYDNNQWENGNEDGQDEIGNPTETIDLGTWTIGQWENGNGDGQEEI